MVNIFSKGDGLSNASSKNQTPILPQILATNLIVVHVASLEVTLFTSMNVYLMIVMLSIEGKRQETCILEILNINKTILVVQIS